MAVFVVAIVEGVVIDDCIEDAAVLDVVVVVVIVDDANNIGFFSIIRVSCNRTSRRKEF